MNTDEYRCHVCGWLLTEAPWGEDGLCPTWIICSCCGCEFGYEDSRASGVRRHRESWLASGGNWFWQKDKPNDWSLEDQLKKIPEDLPKGIDRDD